MCPLVCNGIFYIIAPQERHRAIPNGVAIPDQLVHALAVGSADHPLPAGAPGTQGHCSCASVPNNVPIPSDAQRPSDSRPADHALPAGAPWTQGHCSCASVQSNVPTPSDTQRPNDSRPACARIGRRPCRPRIARRGSRPRESACPPADRCSWRQNALPSSHTGFPDSKSAGCPSPDP